MSEFHSVNLIMPNVLALADVLMTIRQPVYWQTPVSGCISFVIIEEPRK